MKAIVVLGGGVVGLEPTPEAMLRVDKACEIVSDDTLLVMSGNGPSPQSAQEITEARAMAEYARKRGVTTHIIEEDQSYDTIGNACFTREIIDEKQIVDITIVTSPFHLARTEYIFSCVFGTEYTLRFVPSNTLLHDRAESEQKKMRLIKLFFEGIPVGDVNRARTRLQEIYADTNAFKLLRSGREK